MELDGDYEDYGVHFIYGGVYGWVSGGSTHPSGLPMNKVLAGRLGGCWGVIAKKSKKGNKNER